jgi:hypothetical protein
MKKGFAQSRCIAASIAVIAFAMTQSIVWGGNEAVQAYAQEPASGYQAVYVDQMVSQLPAARLVPSISAGDSSISVGNTVAVPAMLSYAPEGLAGFFIELGLSDSSVARISSVEFPGFGLTYDRPLSANSMKLAAVDLYHLIQGDATDSTLAMVNITGLTRGETSLQLHVIYMDDDSGGAITPEVISGMLSVY